MGDDAIDLKTAAERLGVHYQTAYQWVRSGRLDAARVHNRYVIDTDVLDAFMRERDQPAPPPARRPRQGFGPLGEQMHRLLADGDERNARDLVGGLVDDGVDMTTIAERVLAPALAAIGEEWLAGDVNVAVEHRASAIVERIIGEHLPSPRGRRRGHVVVVAPPGDHHTLPTAMAAVALRETNWHVHHLGADVPVDDVVAFCSGNDIDLAVVTVTNSSASAAAAEITSRLEAIHIPTLVGRPGAALTDLQAQAIEAKRTG